MGINDAKTLERREAELVTKREVGMLAITLRKTFDLRHLMSLHRWLFQDVYDWAGKVRTVSITKGQSEFANPTYIEQQANELFARLRDEGLLRRVPLTKVPARIAEYYGNLNSLHPFREGNGRTQRLFFKQLLSARGLTIDWDRVDPHEKVQACIVSHHGDDSRLELIFKRILRGGA